MAAPGGSLLIRGLGHAPAVRRLRKDSSRTPAGTAALLAWAAAAFGCWCGVARQVATGPLGSKSDAATRQPSQRLGGALQRAMH